ncbi:MAG: ATP-binding protein [Chloroflexi bacterium]|nr:ATP-binding protein [Chloroflexota bacterium]
MTNEGLVKCRDTPMMASKCEKRISGPLLDRIDIFVDVPRVDYEKLADHRIGEKGKAVQARVEKAREVQRQRFAGTQLTCNNEMTPVEVRQFCATDAASQSFLRTAMKQMSLSARAFHRVLKPCPEHRTGLPHHRRPFGRLRASSFDRLRASSGRRRPDPVHPLGESDPV